MTQQGAADEQHRVRAVFRARCVDPVELKPAGRTRPRRSQPAQGGGETVADCAARRAVEAETAARVRKHRDIDPGQPEKGPEHERQAHPPREPAGEARVPHLDQSVPRGKRARRIEPENGGAQQDPAKAGGPHEVEVKVDRFKRR